MKIKIGRVISATPLGIVKITLDDGAGTTASFCSDALVRNASHSSLLLLSDEARAQLRKALVGAPVVVEIADLEQSAAAAHSSERRYDGQNHLREVAGWFVALAERHGYQPNVTIEAPDSGHSFLRRVFRARFDTQRGEFNYALIVPVSKLETVFADPKAVAAWVLRTQVAIADGETPPEATFCE